MNDVLILIAICLLAGLAWWVDMMIPRWFKKERNLGKVIPMSPKYSREDNENSSVPLKKSSTEISSSEADKDIFY